MSTGCSINKEELHTIFEELKRQKNEDNFNRLHEKYSSLVYKIAFSIIKNKENSEDIKQIVFLKIWNMDENKLPVEHEASWLYSITKNETLNYIRSQKESIDIEEVYYISIEDKDLEDIVNKDSYNRTISKLNKYEQEILSLKLIADMSFKEIAQMLGEPISTIQWRYYKSLHTLELLVSSLSMFILTSGIFISSRTSKDSILSGIMNGSASESVDSVSSADSVSSTNKVPNEADSWMGAMSTNVAENNVSSNFSASDIGVLSVSGIFLVFSIIFSVIYIKHCRNYAKRKRKN